MITNKYISSKTYIGIPEEKIKKQLIDAISAQFKKIVTDKINSLPSPELISNIHYRVYYRLDTHPDTGENKMMLMLTEKLG